MKRKLALFVAALAAIALPLVGANMPKAVADPAIVCNMVTFSSSQHFTSGACATSGDVWVFQVVAHNTTAAPTISDSNTGDPSIPADGTQYSTPTGRFSQVYTQRIFLHLVTASEATTGFTFAATVPTGATIEFMAGQELSGVCWASCSNYPVDLQTVHASAGPNATTVVANVGGFTTNYAGERAYVASTSWSDAACSCASDLTDITGWSSPGQDSNSAVNTVFRARDFSSVGSAVGNTQSQYTAPVNATGVWVTQMFTIRGS